MADRVRRLAELSPIEQEIVLALIAGRESARHLDELEAAGLLPAGTVYARRRRREVVACALRQDHAYTAGGPDR